MIDVIKQTPAEYSSQSRDYQVIARLYSAILNISQMYTHNLSIWETNIDNKLSLLRAKTLNFSPKHEWDLNDLEAITSCFKYLMKNKGTENALRYCISILMKIENIPGEITENTIKIENNVVQIQLEEKLLTLGIVEDLVEYLLPAGLTYRVHLHKTINLKDIIKTDIWYMGDSSELVKENIQNVSYTKKMHVGDSTEVDKNIDNTFIYDNTQTFKGGN